MGENQVKIDNTWWAAITFALYLGMWSVGGSGQPGALQQFAGTVPITINPGVFSVNVYTNWALPAGDFWMGFAFSNGGNAAITAAQLDALRFLLSDGPTVVSTTSHALLTSALLACTTNPPLASTPSCH